ncbi:MAG TPA: iron ABC transporter permease [candidate division Zixibacteria bacterium]|nr:iron ABC transporter permease [candidate division Zixibacteria bacterium]
MKVLDRKKMLLVNGALLAALGASVAACALLGPVRLDWTRLLRQFPGGPEAEILFRARLPRVLLGAAIGGGMAACGAVLQALLRNPLACPQMLGVSGGASLGGILGLIFLPGWLLPACGALGEISWAPLTAFCGALLSMVLIYRFSLFHGRLHPYHLLLSGVVFNSFIAAVIMFLNSIVDFYQAQGLLFWLMGSLSTRTYVTVAFIWAYVVLGFLWLWSKSLALNLIALGEEAALQLGVETAALQRDVFIASSLMIGAMVSVSGMIGFVGLMIPHVMRLLVGSDHRLLLPASFLAGGVFLAWADTLARIVLAPAELPVGIVTAFFGAPFFLFLLSRGGGRNAAP